MQRWFKGTGTASELFAGRTGEGSRKDALPAEERARRGEDGDVVLVHHNIQSRFVPLLKKVARRANVVVVYHKVTPPELLAGFDAEDLRASRAT